MSNSHPEPWKADWRIVKNSRGFRVAIAEASTDVECAETARRIVACVNACRGLSTDELEQHGLVSAVGSELAELVRQRDELLRDMQDVLDMLINQPHAVTAANQAETMLRLSIGTAKHRVKGGAENHSPDAGKMVAPDGWQFVPVKPTSEMLIAAAIATPRYIAMLAAAPKPVGE